MSVLSGRCHCGNLRFEFDTRHTPESLPLRTCQCSFCRSHGALAAADPQGRVVITAGDPAALQRYRFGLGITDFLLCARCGVYVAAVAEIEGRSYASLNANALDRRAELRQAPQPVSYEGESAEKRRARRAQVWTPAEVLSGAD